jgi:hypothetical protein
MSRNLPSSMLLQRSQGKSCLPAVQFRANPAASAAATVLRTTQQATGQMSLPFFPPGARGG